ncbi:MAG: hypothetical protein ACOC5T_06415 [Elusimicrobiota bacterium]
MKKIYCDFCGKEMEKENIEEARDIGSYFASKMIFYRIEDVCKECYNRFQQKKQEFMKRIDQAKEEYTQKISDIVNEELKQTP